MSYDSPEFDTAGEFEKAKALINLSFPPQPRTPEEAMPLLLLELAAVIPLQRSAADAETLEWMTPGVIDAIERAAAALAEARDELESILDDMGTIEPGTPFAPVDGPQRGMVP
jgi:hypothetical protein